jgi:hypothetical protein
MGQRNPPEGFRIPEDPNLPQLAAALQVRVIAPLLELPPDKAPVCRVAYIRYKPGTNCLVLYEARQPDGWPFWAYAKILAEHAENPKAGRHPLSRYVDELGMCLCRFPYDLEMPSLSLASTGPEAQRVLARLVPFRKRHLFRPYWSGWVPIRYKPERRCVLQGRHEEPGEPGNTRDHYARFYSGAEASRTAGWHRYLGELEGKWLRTPRLLGYSERHKVVLVDRVNGKPLRRFLEGACPDLLGAMELSARALADWHTIPPPPLAPPLPDPIEELTAAVRTVSTLLPEASSLVSELSDQLGRTAPRTASPHVLLHGDFYYDQVLLRSGGRVRFLDLDEIRIGHPAHDVASFCAHLQGLSIRGGMTGKACAEATERFVETYQGNAPHPVPEELLQWHLSMALLRLAPAPFRRFDFDWDHQMHALLQSALSAAGATKCF